MNPRILELREQASQWVVANHQPQDPNTLSQKEIDQRYLMYEEKFAELIVRECVEVVKWTPSQFPNDEYVKNIKEHFGVE